MKITLVGTGYVGLVTGICFANTGNQVICYDIDREKIEHLKTGRMPIYEPGLDELLRRNVKAGRLNFTTDKDVAYPRAEAIFICVGTPGNSRGQVDLSNILAVAREIGDAIDASSGPAGDGDNERQTQIIVVKSTVPVGTCGRIKTQITSRTTKPFRIASNPEFLKEGAAVSDFNRPDRVVIGVEDQDAGDRLRDLYEPFVRQGNPIFIMDIRSAEMVKYASNALLATKISFINEIANLCESYGADVDEVRRGMCSDRRIGNQFLYPGLGYGGSCFPKDVLACISMGQQSQTPTPLLESVHNVNQRQRRVFLDKIHKHFEGQLAGRRFAVWGIAFKPGTDDVREAPSITVIRHLLERGAKVAAHDPVAHTTAHQTLGDAIDYLDDPLSAVEGADALIVCTDWDEFKHPNFDQIKRRMKHAVIFDGRNLYRRSIMKEHGFTYYCVGRHPIVPTNVASDPRR